MFNILKTWNYRIAIAVSLLVTCTASVHASGERGNLQAALNAPDVSRDIEVAQDQKNFDPIKDWPYFKTDIQPILNRADGLGGLGVEFRRVLRKRWKFTTEKIICPPKASHVVNGKAIACQDSDSVAMSFDYFNKLTPETLKKYKDNEDRLRAILRDKQRNAIIHELVRGASLNRSVSEQSFFDAVDLFSRPYLPNAEVLQNQLRNVGFGLFLTQAEIELGAPKSVAGKPCHDQLHNSGSNLSSVFSKAQTLSKSITAISKRFHPKATEVTRSPIPGWCDMKTKEELTETANEKLADLFHGINRWISCHSPSYSTGDLHSAVNWINSDVKELISVRSKAMQCHWTHLESRLNGIYLITYDQSPKGLLRFIPGTSEFVNVRK